MSIYCTVKNTAKYRTLRSGADSDFCPSFQPNLKIDPPLLPSRAAHSMLFVNNLDQNGSHEQRSRFLPAACDGTTIAGMCMSEPGAGNHGGAPTILTEESSKNDQMGFTNLQCCHTL